MDQTLSSGGYRLLKAFGKVLLGVIVLSAVIYAALSAMASHREKTVRDEWTKAGRPLDEFVASLPATKANDTAMAMGDAADRLGLVRSGAREPWRGIAAPISSYLKAELEKAGPPVAAPPPDVAAFLTAQAPLIATIRTALLDGPPPVWVETNRDLYESPIPNLLQFLSVEKILAADALSALNRADRDGALQDLEAGWRLGEALDKRPELISALVTMAGLRYPAAVLRRVDGAPPVWQERLRSYDPYAAVSRSFEYEAASLMGLRHLSFFGPGDSPGFGGRLANALARPYLRLCLADAVHGIFQMEQVAKASGPCPDAMSAAMDKVAAGVPWWDIVGRNIMPNGFAQWGRAYRMQMDLELTRKVLLAKEARDKNGGVWPEAVPGLASSICPEGTWTFTRSADKVVIRYDRTPVYPSAPSKALVLPLAYEDATPPSR